MSQTHYIFVDYENVNKVDLDLIEGRPVVVHLILGEKHKALPVEMVKQFLKFGGQARLVEAGKSGNNALDFVLAYHVGVETVTDGDGYFHIVSGDSGFDALVLHLRKHGIDALRDKTFADAFDSPSEPDRVKMITARLEKNKTNRPKRRKTLLSQINSYFGKSLPPAELEEIVAGLIANKTIVIGAKDEITYTV